MLVLAAPREPRAGGEFDILRDGGAGFLDETAEVASTHIALDDDTAFSVFAADLISAIGAGDGGQIAQGARGGEVRVL